MEEKKHLGYDNEKGIWEGSRIGEDRPINRQRWLEEVFPEWGFYLNRQIEQTEVKPGKVTMWWLGAASWAMKTPAGQIFLIDNYSGPSLYTKYTYCGVCRTSGAEELDWLRLNPHVIDPWGFKKLDAVFCSHHHGDHCDIYTIKATNQTTQCQFIGPKSAVELMRSWGVSDNRITQVKPGDNINFGDTRVSVLFNYDRIASITGVEKPENARSFEEIAASFLFHTPGGNILFLADTLYYNGYRSIGEKYNIDVVTLNMGHNAPGVTDKMSPFDAFRVAQAVGAKVVIPDHYDNWANSQIDPQQLVKIIQDNDPSIKVVILQWGAKFIYPDDQDIGYYKYPDWRERFCPHYSWEYGEPGKKGK